jgi:cobalt-zinc-cadmium efflux system protein
MALVADAAHNLGDVLGLVLAWGAAALARREPSLRRTYGWRKSTILAALANAVLILVAVGGVAWEAIERLFHPPEVQGMTVVVVAAIGVAVNAGSAWLFFADRKRDLNVRAAFTHLAADAAVSVGVVLTGALILATGWHWLDPATSLLIGLVIVLGTWGLLRESLDLVLDAVPAHIDPEEVRGSLVELEGVRGVHDLHVWAVSTEEVALTAHLVVCDLPGAAGLPHRAAGLLEQRFGIHHCTIQLEPEVEEHPCRQATPGSL